MTDLVISGFVIFVLTILIVSDFRNREVSLIWLLVLVIGVMIRSLLSTDFNEVITNIIHNFILISFMSLGIVGYLFFKQRKLTNPLKGYIGSGDLVFILLLTPVWGIKAFTLFLIFGMLGSLIYWAFNRQKTIPLVGTLGITFCTYLIAEIIL